MYWTQLSYRQLTIYLRGLINTINVIFLPKIPLKESQILMGTISTKSREQRIKTAST